jgi:hypothetical protein
MKSFKISGLLALLLLPFHVFSQDKSVEMADALRANGKIYVVVLGLVIILTGVILFLVRIDRKIHKLEKRENLDKV